MKQNYITRGIEINDKKSSQSIISLLACSAKITKLVVPSASAEIVCCDNENECLASKLLLSPENTLTVNSITSCALFIVSNWVNCICRINRKSRNNIGIIKWRNKTPKAKKKYRKAWEKASTAIKADPFSGTLSISEMQRWLTWAENMARQFHCSSSAVEGVNGCLSQMYHNGRSLNHKRLKALTVIHNYGIKREDGTTAAMRLFDIEFPDLFSWLIDEMGGTAFAT